MYFDNSYPNLGSVLNQICYVYTAETRLDELIKSLQKGENETQRTSTSTSARCRDDHLQTFKTPQSSSAAATVASHLLMNDNSNMIPNNQSALLSSNNMSSTGGRPPLPDNYKNNILKAKTFDENKIAEATNVGLNQTSFATDRFNR